MLNNYSEIDVLDHDVKENLKQQLTRNRRQIVRRYASYVYCIRESIKRKETVSGLCAYLMSLTAYDSDQDSNNSVLFSELGEELKAAESIDKIFIILSEKYASFINYEIFEAMVDNYGVTDDKERLNYPQHLKDYVKKHKLTEFIDINPKLKTFSDTSKEVILKLDIDSTCSSAKVVDVKEALANILGLKSAALRILDIKKG